MHVVGVGQRIVSRLTCSAERIPYGVVRITGFEAGVHRYDAFHFGHPSSQAVHRPDFHTALLAEPDEHSLRFSKMLKRF